MNINALSKYIILFLFGVLVVFIILLAIEKADNKRLTKENTRLSEMVALRDTAITEIDKNIAALQQQVLEAESICDERLKARENLLTFLSKEPNWKGTSKASPLSTFPRFQGQVLQKCDSATLDLNKVVSDEKSYTAINYINDYWSMFLTHAGDSKK